MEYDELPTHVMAILERYNETWDSTDEYSNCMKLEKELAEIGWQMTWGLDGIPGDFEPMPGCLQEGQDVH